MKRKTIIRLGAIFFVLASAGVMADEFRLAPTEVAIGTMFFALLLGAGSLAVFLWRAAGWWAAGLGLVGVLAIVASNLFYPTDLFAWMFSLGVLCVGLALLPAGPLARLTSIVWQVGGILGLPATPDMPGGFFYFGVALLLLGYMLWTEAGARKQAVASAIGSVG
jgi:hypothetical protein